MDYDSNGPDYANRPQRERPIDRKREDCAMT